MESLFLDVAASFSVFGEFSGSVEGKGLWVGLARVLGLFLLGWAMSRVALIFSRHVGWCCCGL